ncbi:hypothetical protein QBC34DRAFT_383720 [Podospora aff. communis PSN243]|uniref:Uncharacterized protein n=1 Tax=Podospora aff. communis PSN243 TaxID=3040156 RepID=A0AAV9GFA1_9PEZI|nr:hypothetical protein QBC34DRAFT_383720 [Podospora aff. communis PSN243]
MKLSIAIAAGSLAATSAYVAANPNNGHHLLDPGPVIEPTGTKFPFSGPIKRYHNPMPHRKSTVTSMVTALPDPSITPIPVNKSTSTVKAQPNPHITPIILADGLLPHGEGGALDPTPIFTLPKTAVLDRPPASITIKLVNSAGVDLTTSVNHNVGSPGFITGDPASGTLAKSATATMIAPTGWGGQIAFNKAGKKIQGDEGVVEGSFGIQENVTKEFAVLDIDVSFVNGFTLPIMCYCGDGGGTYLSGCDVDLWKKGTCPDEYDNGQGSCRNPRRDDGIQSPIPFMKECEGRGYTYVKDHAADSNGECQKGIVTCNILSGFHS